MVSTESGTVQGTASAPFAGVREAFAASLAAGEDLGGSVCVIVDGEAVCDLWGGFQDRAKTLPWTRDALACVYSSGKAMLSTLILRAVSDGAMDYDAPLTEHYPGFDAHEKSVSLAEALSHQHGVPGFARAVDPALWLNWDACCAAIADEPPMWPPGTASGYGPQVFGFVAGEALRRATGKSYGEHLRTLGADVLCGLGLAEATRVAPMVKPPRAPDLGEITAETRAAFLEPWSNPAGVSRQAWAAAEIPGSNTHANARGLAGLMQGFATGRVGGAAWASDAAREAVWAERIAGRDRVLPFDLSYGAGVMRERGGDAPIFGGSATAIGHYGFGGSCVVADPARGMSFAYVPNKMSEHLVRDPRAVRLLAAVNAAL